VPTVGYCLLIMMTVIVVVLSTINIGEVYSFLLKWLLARHAGGWGESLGGNACGCHFVLGSDFIYTSSNV
jgi:hypothetical protein